MSDLSRNISLASFTALRKIQTLLSYPGFHRIMNKADTYRPSALSPAGDILTGIRAEQGGWTGSVKRGGSLLNERLYYDTTYGSLPTLLKYDDKIGMAFSVETRVPFLDHRLVELVFSLSPFVKIRNGWKKYILREAMNGILPNEIRWRRDKVPFTMPFNEWLQGKLLSDVEERILEGKLPDNGYLNGNKLKLLFRGHRKRQYDISPLIWKWLCLSIWFELHKQLPDKSPAAT